MDAFNTGILVGVALGVLLAALTYLLACFLGAWAECYRPTHSNLDVNDPPQCRPGKQRGRQHKGPLPDTDWPRS